MRPATARRRRSASAEPIRVAEFVRTSSGGAWLVEMSKELRKCGYDVHAVVGGSRGPLSSAFDAAGIPCHVIPMTAVGAGKVSDRPTLLQKLAYGAHLAWASVRLAVLLRGMRVDVLHSHVFMSILMGRIAGWLARVPVRISMVPGPSHLLARLPRALDRATLRLDDRTVASCEFTERIYRAMGVPEEQRALIYYGPDAAKFDPGKGDGGRVRRELGVGADTPLIGMIAYFYPPNRRPTTPPMLQGRGLKGHEYFLDAALRVREQRPDARFLLVGDGLVEPGRRYREALQRRAVEMGLEDSVIFTGFRSDVRDVLAALDVAVQCSLMENLGGTLESLLMATPTVATRVGGMPESVRDGVTGKLVPPADPDALAEAILEMLHDPERARALAAAGRELMLSRFTLQRTVADLDALFRDTCREHGGSLIRFGRDPIRGDGSARSTVGGARPSGG